MNPIQRSLYSHLPPSEGDHHHQVYLHPFLPTYEEGPSFPCAIFLSPSQERSSSERDHLHSHHQQQEVKENFSFYGGSSDHGGLIPRSASTMAEDGEGTQENSAGDGDPPNGTGSGKWMSSKMRFMRKMMMGSDRITTSKPRKTTLELQDPQVKVGDSNNTNISPSHGTTTIRVCSDCNTTKTPLWRSGPHGPKSLCNACGIRQRKARRAMAAAAALAGGLIPPVTPPVKGRKEKRPEGGCTVPFKKRFKFTAAGQTRRKKLRLDDFAIDLSKSSAFHRVFPQDEKEAAILLMGLSCGLIHS